MTRQEALRRNLKRYGPTGKPCKRGHVAERYVSSCQCVECVAEGLRRFKDRHTKEDWLDRRKRIDTAFRLRTFGPPKASEAGGAKTR